MTVGITGTTVSPRQSLTSPLPSRLASRRATCLVATLPTMATTRQWLAASRRFRAALARAQSPDSHYLGWGIDHPPMPQSGKALGSTEPPGSPDRVTVGSAEQSSESPVSPAADL